MALNNVYKNFLKFEEEITIKFGGKTKNGW